MRHVVWAILVLLMLPVMTAAGPFKPREELAKFDPGWREKRRRLKGELAPLTEQIRLLEQAGRDIACARDIADETIWLLDSTAAFPAAERRLSELRRALERAPDRPARRVQSTTDGGWSCYREWFKRLDATTGTILQLEEAGQSPVRHVALLDRINSPERLTRYLESVLLSDVAGEGVDRRKELNEATSCLMRLILRRLPKGYPYHPGLERALLEFVDRRWRNPQTGFWGAWYRTPAGILKTDDLSITFHLASYRNTEPFSPDAERLWSRLFETLMAMRSQRYPRGWMAGDGPSAHHAYDVVRLMRLAWPRLRPSQRRRAAREIRRLVDWALSHALLPDGSFRSESEEDAPGDRYYFGVSLLEEAGVFSSARRFWTDEPFPGGDALRRRIALRLLREPRDTGRSGLFLQQALRKLRAG